MTGTTLFLPTYPTMPHMGKPQGLDAATRRGRNGILRCTGLVELRGQCARLRTGLFARQATIKGEFEILSLADTLQAFVTHLLEGALNGFALWIENTLLQRDVDVGCHKGIIIRGEFLHRKAGRRHSLNI